MLFHKVVTYEETHFQQPLLLNVALFRLQQQFSKVVLFRILKHFTKYFLFLNSKCKLPSAILHKCCLFLNSKLTFNCIFSCHFGTQSRLLIFNNLQQSSTCSNNDKIHSRKRKTKMLIQLSIFQFELNIGKDNTKFNRNVRYLCFKLLSFVIILVLPYAHYLMVLRLHLSSIIIYGHVLFLFS